MENRPVYVVDDEEPIRRSASLLLKVSGFTPSAFDCGPSFLDAQAELEPGCVLLDIRMPGLDGIAVQRRLTDVNSAHATVVMTGHGDVSSAVAALEAGAITFVEKPFSKAQLLPAVELAFSRIGEPGLYRARLEAARDQVAGLAEREQAVLSLLVQDHSSEQIAALLQMSPAELDSSRTRILDQLGVESVPAALTIAFAAARAAG